VRTNTPDMNITNQINAGLNDLWTTLIERATWAKTPDISDQRRAENKALYQFDMILSMVRQHREGINQPWSDRRHQVDEEFSE